MSDKPANFFSTNANEAGELVEASNRFSTVTFNVVAVFHADTSIEAPAFQFLVGTPAMFSGLVDVILAVKSVRGIAVSKTRS